MFMCGFSELQSEKATGSNLSLQPKQPMWPLCQQQSVSACWGNTWHTSTCTACVPASLMMFWLPLSFELDMQPFSEGLILQRDHLCLQSLCFHGTCVPAVTDSGAVRDGTWGGCRETGKRVMWPTCDMWCAKWSIKMLLVAGIQALFSQYPLVFYEFIKHVKQSS